MLGEYISLTITGFIICVLGVSFSIIYYYHYCIDYYCCCNKYNTFEETLTPEEEITNDL
jgi:hypothetical protein